MRIAFLLSHLALALLLVLLILALHLSHPLVITLSCILALTLSLGVYDMLQTRHTIRRNFPLVGRVRWIGEWMRPFVRQYLIESDVDGRPISRMFRAIVYQRAKGDLDTIPYGTRVDTYRNGYEWLGHSIAALNLSELDTDPRVLIGGPECRQPYKASVLNVSAMSFGSLSHAAIRALNKGAQMGGFYHNTGEGGISDYHLQYGGDLVWQIGTGYFGCRTPEGTFSLERFKEKAGLDVVKMIEVKLSQGAKPGHGGILPASKNTGEIARIRHVTPYTDVISPSAHPAFSTPVEMMEFIATLREASDGKPVGFKLCVGRESEFVAICKAMRQTGIKPDFITVDGGEGGTGAAPLEYSNSVGMPLRDGLVFVKDCLRGFDLDHDIRIIAAGKITTAFHVAKTIAMGADICNCARSMMLALGCVHSLICNTNRCPTGVATQDPQLIKGLDVEDKSHRVARYHRETVHALVDMASSAGLTSPCELDRSHVYRRVEQDRTARYDEMYPYPEAGSFLKEPYPARFHRPLEESTALSFLSQPRPQAPAA